MPALCFPDNGADVDSPAYSAENRVPRPESDYTGILDPGTVRDLSGEMAGGGGADHFASSSADSGDGLLLVLSLAGIFLALRR